mgnify:CR=1 FL=1
MSCSMTSSTGNERFAAVIEAIQEKDSYALIVALAVLAIPSWGPVPPATPKECKEAVKAQKPNS